MVKQHVVNVKDCGSSPFLPSNGRLAHVGRALDLHSRGRGFDSPTVHQGSDDER